ncbi:MAG: quinolinate synthase [Candidatus Latescibacterota bacterium]|nr:MAG: quinolinate synthase [Candidatus Latescibacterota bacterium]
MEDRELIERIMKLKKDRNAVILVHNYQPGEVQDIADFLGDSLELSRKAAESDADVIVFCGVRFMAETAAILCPDKTVLLPDPEAGCPLADMVTVEALRRKKAEHPEAFVVCYVNSSAEVKAESDVCCTSANAVRIVEQIDGKVLFVPDQYLGRHVASRTGKELILWPGFCPVHMNILPQDIEELKREHPEARVVVHPECRPEVTALADEVLSTGGMCRYAGETESQTLIVGTEVGILHRLRRENPGKTFLPASERAVCSNMKRITPEKVLHSLEDLSPRVEVPEDIRLRAKAALDAMVQVG